MNELTSAIVLTLLSLAFLCGFWFAPHGILFLRRLAGGDLQVDVRPTFTPDTLYRLLQKYGAAGRNHFRSMLYVDMVFPVVYAATIYKLADVLLGLHPSTALPAAFARCAVIAAAAFDYCENLLLLNILRKLPARLNIQARCAGICTTMKFLSLIIAMSALVVGWSK